MLRWIIAFAVLCAVSATLGFERLVPSASAWSGVSLVVLAFSAVLLIASFDAFESQGTAADEG